MDKNLFFAMRGFGNWWHSTSFPTSFKLFPAAPSWLFGDNPVFQNRVNGYARLSDGNGYNKLELSSNKNKVTHPQLGDKYQLMPSQASKSSSTE